MTVRAAALVAALGVWASAGSASAAERTPVAILWAGDPGSVEQGTRVAEEVQRALSRSKTARGLDSAEDRRLLVEGGPVSRAAEAQARAEALFVKLKFADAAKEFEAVERILLEDVPLSVTQARLGAVERNLLVCYDQLGRATDAARAAERLGWTAGTNDDVKPLLDKHLPVRDYMPPLPPVQVATEPPGAEVARDLRPLGVAPLAVPGGDPRVDVLDVTLPGYRRLHAQLGRGGAVTLTLVPEDRLGVLVDAVRVGAEPGPAELTALGKRVGAARLLVLQPDGPKIIAHVFDVKTQGWASPSIKVDSQGQPAMERLAGYAAPQPPPPPAVVASVQQASKPPEKKKSKWGSWGKWYTWAAAGGVVLIVGGLLIAQSVGSDNLKINVTK